MQKEEVFSIFICQIPLLLCIIVMAVKIGGSRWGKNFWAAAYCENNVHKYL